jgi:hypothetical protein
LVVTEPLDERYKLTYEAASDATNVQHSVLDNLRGRATAMFSATTIVTTLATSVGLLGSGTSLPKWSVYAALGFVIAVGTCAFFILWPRTWTFGFDGETMIDEYIESSEPLSLSDMYRDMAIYLSRHQADNDRQLGLRLHVFELGLLLLTAEVSVLLAGFLTR